MSRNCEGGSFARSQADAANLTSSSRPVLAPCTSKRVGPDPRYRPAERPGDRPCGACVQQGSAKGQGDSCMWSLQCNISHDKRSSHNQHHPSLQLRRSTQARRSPQFPNATDSELVCPHACDILTGSKGHRRHGKSGRASAPHNSAGVSYARCVQGHGSCCHGNTGSETSVSFSSVAPLARPNVVRAGNSGPARTLCRSAGQSNQSRTSVRSKHGSNNERGLEFSVTDQSHSAGFLGWRQGQGGSGEGSGGQ